jgi:hypothetical protein
MRHWTEFVKSEIACTASAKPLQFLLPGSGGRIGRFRYKELARSEVFEAGIALGVRAITDHGLILLSRFLFRVEVKKGTNTGTKSCPF